MQMNHIETIKSMLDIQTLNIIRERNTGEMFLFVILDRGEKPSEINFFFGVDAKDKIDMVPSCMCVDNLTIPSDGGKCVNKFRNIFIQNKNREVWTENASDYRVIYITKDKKQIMLEDKDKKIITSKDIREYKVYNIGKPSVTNKKSPSPLASSNQEFQSDE